MTLEKKLISGLYKSGLYVFYTFSKVCLKDDIVLRFHEAKEAPLPHFRPEEL